MRTSLLRTGLLRTSLLRTVTPQVRRPRHRQRRPRRRRARLPRYATEGSNPVPADRVPGRSATHTFEPCLGQPCRCARTRTSRRAAPKARTPDSQAGSQAGLGLLLTRVRLALHRRGSEAAYRSELLFRRASEARSTLIAVMKAAAPSEEGGDEDEGEAVCHTGLEPRTSRR